uniref:Uncharacterized protein n=1 Tax=Glossina austeni TaxID=7395 RepID=A0A1A9VVQ7_GLOAU
MTNSYLESLCQSRLAIVQIPNFQNWVMPSIPCDGTTDSAFRIVETVRQSYTIIKVNLVTKANCNHKQLESESYDKLLMCNSSCYQSEGKAIVSNNNVSMMSAEKCKQRNNEVQANLLKLVE